MSGKATFYEPGRGRYKQLRQRPHPSQVAEQIEEIEPKKTIEDVLGELEVLPKKGQPTGPSAMLRVKPSAEQSAAVKDLMTFLSTVSASMKNLPVLISTQDIIATLEELTEFCRDESNAPKVRDIFANKKIDVPSEAVIIQALFRRDRAADRTPYRADPGELSLRELGLVVRDALLDLPRSRGGKPKSGTGEADPQLILECVKRVLAVNPELKGTFAEDPRICFDLLDCMFRCECESRDDQYLEILSAQYDWFPKTLPDFSESSEPLL